MSKKRKDDGFNLAFLDVMACGLGAVLMILIVVKFNANSSIPTTELERLQQQLAALNNEASEIKKNVQEVNDNIAMEAADIQATKRQISQLKTQQKATQQAIAQQQAVLADLEQAVAASAAKQADDLLAIQGTGEEQYLLGLKVQGKRIGILVDASASMTDEGLIDVIRRKIQPDAVKQLGPKWLRTLRTAKWMIARLPKEAQVSVVAFNETAKVLGNRAVNSAKVSASLEAVVAELDTLVPHKGTNLQVGLQAIVQAMPNMTDLYVITDGLPTQLNVGSGFKESRVCKPESKTTKTITGDCRFKVFLHTFSRFAPKNVVTNIVLLPLQGDSQAPAAYWNWASTTGGTFISPAETWP